MSPCRVLMACLVIACRLVKSNPFVSRIHGSMLFALLALSGLHWQYRECQCLAPSKLHSSVREVETEPGSLNVQATTLGKALLARAHKQQPRSTSGRALCQPRAAVLASTVTGACELGKMHTRRSYRRPRPGIGSTPRRAA